MSTSNNNINVIICEDNHVFLKALVLILSQDPRFRILDTCRNGVELVESNQLEKADLLLLDIEMPEMNGLEVAEIVKTEYPDMPMIAITMLDDHLYLDAIRNSGITGYIHKPLVPKLIFKVIDNTLKKINTTANFVELGFQEICHN